MKKLLSAIILLFTVSLFSCEKENEVSTIEGQWFIRTQLEQISSSQNTTTTLYKVYKRWDVGARRYSTFDFTKDKLIIKEYTRDQDLNKDIVNTTEYSYQLTNNKMLLTDASGRDKSYNFSFIGLSNRNLMLEFLENILDPNEGSVSKSSKFLLIREFPIDDSEGEVLPPQPNLPTPTEPDA